MEYRALGKTGLRVSEIALGNWVTHGSQIDEDAAAACVKAAFDNGIDFFDTADVYATGAAEEVLGRVLKGVRRSSYVLATKCMGTMGPGQNDNGLSRKHIIEACEASLKRLQTDYVDIYQAHRYDPRVPLEETLRAFEDLVRAGKVLYLGISEWSPDQIRDALRIAGERGWDRIVSSQPQYSMLWRVPEKEVIPLCRDEGIGQIVWSPLGQGVLTGKYLPGQPPPEGSRVAHGQGYDKSFMEDKVLSRVQELKPLASDAGLSLPQLALAWVLVNDNVASAIIGATRPEQVTDNAGASGAKIDDAVLKRIDEILADVVIRKSPY